MSAASSTHWPSAREEMANAASHGVGLLAAVALAPVLIVQAVRHGDAASVVGACVFAAAAILLYLASTLYHALPRGRAKLLFQRLDHVAIYVLIAGTYTPFTLGVLRGTWGWLLFGAVWGLALAGIIMKAVTGLRHPRLSLALYVAMGWLVIVAIDPLLTALPRAGLAWLVAGGACYTLGIVFFATDERVRYHHVVWHVFVLAGTACHAVAVLRYAAYPG